MAWGWPWNMERSMVFYSMYWEYLTGSVSVIACPWGPLAASSGVVVLPGRCHGPNGGEGTGDSLHGKMAVIV